MQHAIVWEPAEGGRILRSPPEVEVRPVREEKRGAYPLPSVSRCCHSLDQRRAVEQNAFSLFVADWAIEELVILEVNLDKRRALLEGALDQRF